MQDQPIPYGFCECGCGARTPLATRTRRERGYIAGQPTRYLPSHSTRTTPSRYEERACGYKTPCWVWLGSLNHRGYGLRNNGRGTALVHVQMWIKAHGPVPAGLQLDHLCRNRACVNPAHLEPVTGTENVRRGNVTKLDAESVREIRASNDTPLEIAQRFGVSRSAIYMIRNGHLWKDVTP